MSLLRQFALAPQEDDLAALTPKGGKPGRIIEGEKINDWLQTEVFRHDLARATSSQDIWQWLVFAASVLFFFDVLVRRVVVGFGWAVPAAVAVIH
ncbi:MAG: hypothetical protein HY000_20835 [Planctomycetes bacterium]|nr:hypothetical protein [Planctomycetota bacterium]